MNILSKDISIEIIPFIYYNVLSLPQHVLTSLLQLYTNKLKLQLQLVCIGKVPEKKNCSTLGALC